MPLIEVHGLASGRSVVFDVDEQELRSNLLNWLRSHNITVASSCDGKGVCKKCVIQNDWLSCMLTLKDFFQRQPDGKIFIKYL